MGRRRAARVVPGLQPRKLESADVVQERTGSAPRRGGRISRRSWPLVPKTKGYAWHVPIAVGGFRKLDRHLAILVPCETRGTDPARGGHLRRPHRRDVPAVPHHQPRGPHPERLRVDRDDRRVHSARRHPHCRRSWLPCACRDPAFRPGVARLGIGLTLPSLVARQGAASPERHGSLGNHGRRQEQCIPIWTLAARHLPHPRTYASPTGGGDSVSSLLSTSLDLFSPKRRSTSARKPILKSCCDPITCVRAS
jgi:hypothetical protein